MTKYPSQIQVKLFGVPRTLTESLSIRPTRGLSTGNFSAQFGDLTFYLQCHETRSCAGAEVLICDGNGNETVARSGTCKSVEAAVEVVERKLIALQANITNLMLGK